MHPYLLFFAVYKFRIILKRLHVAPRFGACGEVVVGATPRGCPFCHVVAILPRGFPVFGRWVWFFYGFDGWL